MAVDPPNHFEDYSSILIGLRTILYEITQLKWLKLDHFVIVAHGKVVNHLLDLGVVLLGLLLPCCLHNPDVDLLRVFV